MEAERLYKKVIELNPKDAGAYANLADAQMKLDKKEEALKNRQKAIELGLK